MEYIIKVKGKFQSKEEAEEYVASIINKENINDFEIVPNPLSLF